jgi:hypothetical protein
MQHKVRSSHVLAAVTAGASLLLLSATSFAGTPSLGASCGSGASIVGNDSAGKVTLGSGSGLCVLTFSTAYTNAPACTAVNETNGGAHAVPAGVKTTTTTLVFDGAAPWSDGDTLAYGCQSY